MVQYADRLASWSVPPWTCAVKMMFGEMARRTPARLQSTCLARANHGHPDGFPLPSKTCILEKLGTLSSV